MTGPAPMPASTPRAWGRPRSPVRHGTAPGAVITLADLARIDAFRTCAAGYGPARRRTGAALVRHAVTTVVTVVIGAFVFDGLVLDVAATDLGFVLDDTAGLATCWVGAARPTNAPDPGAHLGVAARALLAPVASAARASGVGARASDRAMLDRLAAGCARLERAAPPAPAWIDDLLAASGFGDPALVRRLEVRPDAGPSIAMPLPGVCCVAQRRPGPNACPTCPLHPDDPTRRHLTESWLGEVDDDHFRFVVGRDRQT